MTYETDILAWRTSKNDELTNDEGWLTLAGLFWLHDGDNSIGSDPDCEIVIPSGNAYLGSLEFADNQAILKVTSGELVLIDGAPSAESVLRDDAAADGPSVVKVGPITFFVIKRGDQYAIRVRDESSPTRFTFAGRHWFALNPDYRVPAKFVPHPMARTLEVATSAGTTEMMKNRGYVEFSLNGQLARLEALENEEGNLWLIFKDGTSGKLTYKAGRFLVAPPATDGSTIIDFNRAYHPPCAYTLYATCPLPPRENILPFPIEAGERYPAAEVHPDSLTL